MPKEIDANELWRRIGLERLRFALKNVREKSQQFEAALERLPECNQCARLALLKEIEQTAQELSSEVASLGGLTQSLESALSTAKECCQNLEEKTPSPCRCAPDKCVCH